MSDLSNQEKLEQIYQMTLENNEVLRSIRRQQFMASFFSILYWVMILGAIGSTYYFVRPFISAFTANGEKVSQTIEQFNQLKSQLEDKSLFNQVMKNLNPQVKETPATTTQ